MFTIEFEGALDVRALWSTVLSDDPSSHVFYEPKVILRTSDLEKVLNEIQGHRFRIYDYPQPNSSIQGYREEPCGIVDRNLPLFLPIFHYLTEVSMTKDANEQQCFRTALIRKLLNAKQFEGKEKDVLLELASIKTNDLRKVSLKCDPEYVGEIEPRIVELFKIAKAHFEFEDYLLFVERVIHICYNTQGLSRTREGRELYTIAQSYKRCVML